MPLIRLQTIARARRARLNGPRCRGGASSLLRVGQPTLTIVPVSRALAQRLGAAPHPSSEGA